MPDNKPTTDLFDLLDVRVRREPDGAVFAPEPFYIIKVAEWEKLVGFLRQQLLPEDYAKLPGLGIELQRYDFVPDEENEPLDIVSAIHELHDEDGDLIESQIEET